MMDAVLNLANAHRWDEATAAFHALCQHHVDRRQPDQLVAAVRSPLEASCPRDAVLQIDACLGDTKAFETELLAALELAAGCAAGRSDIAALYAEYFFDGGDSSSVDFFLCQSFTRDDDDWASGFRASDVIAGPGIQALLNYDPELDLEPAANFIAGAYAHAVLLLSFFRVVDTYRCRDLPIGFAQHDHPIVYF